MKYLDRSAAFLFSISVFFMMFDLLQVYPGISISIYRIVQVIILVLAITFLLLKKGLKFNLNNTTLLLMGGFILIAFLSSFFSVNISISLLEAFRIVQLAISTFVMFLLLKSVWKEEYWIYFSTIMLFCGFITSLSIITDFLGVTNFSLWYIREITSLGLRQFGILGESNFAAGKLGIFLPFVLFLWQFYTLHTRLGKAIFSLITLSIILLAIFLTGSRMGGVIIAFSLMVFLIKEWKWVLTYRTIFTVLITVLVMILFSLTIGISVSDFQLSNNYIARRYMNLLIYFGVMHKKMTPDSSIITRVHLFFSGLKMFVDHPMVGVGLGNFKYMICRYGVFKPIQYSHNTFISVLDETGLIGFVFFIGLFVQVGKNIYYHYHSSNYRKFYFYLGLSFINCIIMLFFLHDLGNKYFWGMFIVLSIYSDYIKRYRRGKRKNAITKAND